MGLGQHIGEKGGAGRQAAAVGLAHQPGRQFSVDNSRRPALPDHMIRQAFDEKRGPFGAGRGLRALQIEQGLGLVTARAFVLEQSAAQLADVGGEKVSPGLGKGRNQGAALVESLQPEQGNFRGACVNS